MELETGKCYEVEISDLASGGEAVGRVEDLVVFIPYGVPGDTVEIELVELKKKYARGSITRIIKPSSHRIEPRCHIFYKCGGCQLQHIDYPSQLIFKKKIVEDFLARISGIKDVKVMDVLESQEPWYYRNKVQLVAASKPYFPAFRKTEDTFLRSFPYFGLYERESHKVVRMEACAIQHPLNNLVLQVAQEALGKLGWSIYSEKTGEGLARYIISRISTVRNEALVVFVVTEKEIPRAKDLINIFKKKAPQVKGILQNINPDKTNVILGKQSKLLWGQDYILEVMNGIQYKISADSFFQVNPEQILKMFKIVEKYSGIRNTDTVIDAYSGVGTLAIWLAQKAKKVIGIEEVSSAVKDAQENVKLNKIKNVEFYKGKTEKVLPRLLNEEVRADVVILDPPRKGCEPVVLETLAKMRVEKIIYVSCNPATLARDIAILSELGYKTHEIQPVDVFPQTAHIECVAKIEKA